MERSSALTREVLSLIDVFVASVEAGSFAGAAARLHLTRSAVGKSVARLEERLGVRLVERNARQFAVTAEGQSFFEHAARALDALGEGLDALEEGRSELRGRVHVSMPVVFGKRFVAPTLVALAARHPQLDLTLSLTDRVVDLAAENVDVALRIGPVAATHELVARSLGGHLMRVCGAPAYLRRAGRPRGIDDLDRHACITYSRAGRPGPWVFLGDAGQPMALDVRPRLAADDLEVALQAVLAGHGLGRLPSWLVDEHIASGALEVALQEPRPFRHEMFAVWTHRRALPRRVRTVVDVLAAQVGTVLAAQPVDGEDRA